MIFNALLARRVAAGDWSQLASGDIASLEGSGSHFMVRDVDDELQQRLAAFDIHPSGPLWGRGDPETQGRAGRYESEAAAEFAEVANLLAVQGLVQERRPLRCAVKNLTVEGEPGTLTLGFELGRGQFATAVLRELCEFAAADALESDDE
jgi:tRNA pseudouridine13 synthase